MKKSLFVIYAIVITIMPVVALAPIHGGDSAFWLLAGDAYLYLGIATTSTAEFFSFDGETPTNGFHPLWQFWVWLVASRTGDTYALINIVAWSSVALTLVGVLFLGAAIARATGSWLLAALATPGVYFLTVGQGLGNLAVWEFYSGMEAGLAFALSGLAAWLIAGFGHDERRPRAWLSLGLVLALLLLTRLDEVFVAPAVALAWLIWNPRDMLRRLPAVVMVGLLPAAALAGYLYYNITHIGVPMPVSGAAKGEGALLSNIYVTLATVFAPVVDLRGAFTDYVPAHAALGGAGFRVAELVFPALFCVFSIGLLWRYFRDDAWAPLVAGLCVAVVIKAGYNFGQVNFWHQAPWYFAFAVAVMSFVTALLLLPVAVWWNEVAPVGRGLVVATLGFVAALQASQSYLDRAVQREPLERRDFWQARATTEAALDAARPGAKLIEFGDGMLNFALERPVRHGFVFAGDTGSLAALKQGRLLNASYDDGYSILASYEYLRWDDAGPDRTSGEIRAYLSGSLLDDRVKAELQDFDFEVIHVYEPLSLPFFAMTRRQAAPADSG